MLFDDERERRSKKRFRSSQVKVHGMQSVRCDIITVVNFLYNRNDPVNMASNPAYYIHHLNEEDVSGSQTMTQSNTYESVTDH